MKLTAIIIDDNQASINLLKKLLQEFFKEIEILESYNAVAKSINGIETLKPDIVFLDVEMPGEDGFQLFKYIPQPAFETIFITAYEEYAVEAFRVNSIDYIIKPINPADLKNAIERVKEKRSNQKNNKTEKKPKIAIQTKTGIEFLNIVDIFYCQAMDNYTLIYTANDKKIVSKPLKVFEDLLQNSGFFRTSRSYLVNIKYIKSLSTGKKLSVELENDAVVPVSQSNKKDLITMLNDDEVINL